MISDSIEIILVLFVSVVLVYIMATILTNVESSVYSLPSFSWIWVVVPFIVVLILAFKKVLGSESKQNYYS